MDARWTEGRMLEAQGMLWIAAVLRRKVFDGSRQIPFVGLLRMVCGEYQRRVSVGYQWKVFVVHQLRVSVVHP